MKYAIFEFIFAHIITLMSVGVTYLVFWLLTDYNVQASTWILFYIAMFTIYMVDLKNMNKNE